MNLFSHINSRILIKQDFGDSSLLEIPQESSFENISEKVEDISKKRIPKSDENSTQKNSIRYEEIKEISLFNREIKDSISQEDFDRVESTLKKIGTLQKKREGYEKIFSQKIPFYAANDKFFPVPDQAEFAHITKIESATRILKTYETYKEKCGFFTLQPFFSASLHHPLFERDLYGNRNTMTVGFIFKVPPKMILLAGSTDLFSPTNEELNEKKSYTFVHHEFSVFREYVERLYQISKPPKHLVYKKIEGWLFNPPKPLIKLSRLISFYEKTKTKNTQEQFTLLFQRQPNEGETVLTELQKILEETNKMCLVKKRFMIEKHLFSKPEKLFKKTATIRHEGKLIQKSIHSLNEAIILTHSYLDEKVTLAALLLGKSSKKELDEEEKNLVEKAESLRIPVFYEQQLDTHKNDQKDI